MSRGNTWHLDADGTTIESCIKAPVFDAMANPGEKKGDEPRVRIWTKSLVDASTSGYQTLDLSDAKNLASVLAKVITAAEDLG